MLALSQKMNSAMKTLTITMLAGFLAFLSGCKRSEDVEFTANTASAPSFNQVNVTFQDSQRQCLLNQWYNRKYQNEPIVFRVINDDRTYTAFFSCSSANSLLPIDFATSSLLIGMKADYGQFINTPVNISNINQVLTSTGNGNYTLQVRVTGEVSKSTQGGEWFAFTSVVPKITGSVNLDMQYQFK